VPPALGRRDELQAWSGYCPECDLEGHSACERLPCQTANIKVSGQYEGIEVADNEWMQMACEEARRSVEAKGGPFGAVIVQIDDQTGAVIRYWRNHNHVVLWNDPTAHAEVTTIRAVCKELGVFDLGRIEKEKSRMPQEGASSHCEIYSSAEPCPMCFAAIAWARIPTLVFAATRYDAAAQGVNFSDEAIYAELAKPYRQREMRVFQSSTPGSLDAFNRWKRMKKVPY
jgi:tRNA(Arg) A34 adenosine deaminase TadA